MNFEEGKPTAGDGWKEQPPRWDEHRMEVGLGVTGRNRNQETVQGERAVRERGVHQLVRFRPGRQSVHWGKSEGPDV